MKHQQKGIPHKAEQSTRKAKEASPQASEIVPRSLKCAFGACGRFFKPITEGKVDLEKHIMAMHTLKFSAWLCEMCHATFSTPQQAYRGM